MMLLCQYNQLSNLTLYDGLIDLNCSYNQLENLDLQNNNFSIIDVSHNQLTSIDLSGVTAIYEGYFNDNEFPELNFPAFQNPTNFIHELDISNNALASFSLTVRTDRFKCWNTQIESINFPVGMPTSNSGDYSIENNPNLESINLKNGVYDFASWDEVFSYSLPLANNPNLQTICVDDISQNGISETQYLLTELGTNSTVNISTECLLKSGSFVKQDILLIYPNPLNNLLNIESNDKIRSVEVSNNLGQSILKAGEANQVDVSNLSAGIYFIKVNSEKGKSTQKFIKL